MDPRRWEEGGDEIEGPISAVGARARDPAREKPVKDAFSGYRGGLWPVASFMHSTHPEGFYVVSGAEIRHGRAQLYAERQD